MKIRSGFVSNSSSSSFAVYGVEIEEFLPFYYKITGKKGTKLSKSIEADDGEEYELSEEMANEIIKVLKKKGFDFDIVLNTGYENFKPDGSFVIGKDLNNINEEEDSLATLMTARENLKKIIGDKKPEFYSGEKN